MSIEERQAICEVVNNAKVIRTFLNLYYRWEDEWRYEDFADYASVMHKCMPNGAKLVRGTQEPFGLVIEYGGREVSVYLKFTDDYVSLVAEY
jgi:hypothetical protein